MESEYSTLTDDAACIASSGRWDAVNERIKEFAANPGGPDNVWWVELFAGLCSQVFSEYLKLKRAYQENTATDASEIAWRARNLLELFVWSRYCASSRDNARRLYDDARHDMSGVLAAFKKWGEAKAQKAEWFEGGTGAQQDVSNRAFSDGIASTTATFMEVRKAAEQVGFGDDFKLLYKVLSKCAHPTAMQIMFSYELTTWQRDSFFSQGCHFFTGAFLALERQVPPKTPDSV